jgi:hypothetical protein
LPKVLQQDKLTSLARNMFPICFKLDLGNPVIKDFKINYKAHILSGSIYNYNNNKFLVTEIHENGNLKRNIYLVENDKLFAI